MRAVEAAVAPYRSTLESGNHHEKLLTDALPSLCVGDYEYDARRAVRCCCPQCQSLIWTFIHGSVDVRYSYIGSLGVQ